MKLRWSVYYNRFDYWCDFEERFVTTERDSEAILEYFCERTNMWKAVPVERICVHDSTGSTS